MDISNILLLAKGTDENDRTEAMATLNRLHNDHIQLLIDSLPNIIGNHEQPADVRKIAFECFSSINYEAIGPCMENLVQPSLMVVGGDEYHVSLHAIKLWISICEKELELQGHTVLETWAPPPPPPHFQLAQRIYPQLVPLLLIKLVKQEDDRMWDISEESEKCLGLIARSIGNAILPTVRTFIEANISNPDWHYRVAAVSSLTSILEGPKMNQTHSSFILPKVAVLLDKMKDESDDRVKDAASLGLRRIFELGYFPNLHFSEITPAHTEFILSAFVGVLEGAKRHRGAPYCNKVVVNVCDAIYFLAKQYEIAGASPVLPQYLKNIEEYLMLVGLGSVSDEHKVRIAA